MKTLKRTDCHCPSKINPSEYTYIGVAYMKHNDIESSMVLDMHRSVIANHSKKTNAKYSDHEHGGTCHICGAWALYIAVFYHAASNTYIRTGFDCADKLDMGNAQDFRSIKRAVKSAREAKAGKAKAKLLLNDHDLMRAWAISEMTDAEIVVLGATTKIDTLSDDVRACDEVQTLRSIVQGVVKYGRFSDKQVNFVRVLVDRIDNKKKRDAEIAAERAAQRADAADCPNEDRCKITGEVIKVVERDSQWGLTYKMTVKDTNGFCVWGTVPASLKDIEYTAPKIKDTLEEYAHTVGFALDTCNDEERVAVEKAYERQTQHVTKHRMIDRGDHVTFTANVKQSDKDSKFGFYNRPTKAQIVSS
jgi:hypothetical protein